MSKQKNESNYRVYFDSIRVSKINSKDIQQQQLQTLIHKRMNNIAAAIICGQLIFLNKDSLKQQIDLLQKKRKKKEIELGSISIAENQEEFKKIKRTILAYKRQQAQLFHQYCRIKKINNLESVKKWNQQQKQSKLRKENQELLKHTKQAKDQMQKQEGKKELQIFQQQQKINIIEHKLTKIQQNKQQRIETKKLANIQYKKLKSKYIQIKHKYQEIQSNSLENNQNKKCSPIVHKIDFQTIKNHQKQYLLKVQERLLRRASVVSLKSEAILKNSEFIKFLNRDELKINQQKQKWNRRKAFQQELKKQSIKLTQNHKQKNKIIQHKIKLLPNADIITNNQQMNQKNRKKIENEDFMQVNIKSKQQIQLINSKKTIQSEATNFQERLQFVQMKAQKSLKLKLNKNQQNISQEYYLNKVISSNSSKMQVISDFNEIDEVIKLSDLNKITLLQKNGINNNLNFSFQQ